MKRPSFDEVMPLDREKCDNKGMKHTTRSRTGRSAQMARDGNNHRISEESFPSWTSCMAACSSCVGCVPACMPCVMYKVYIFNTAAFQAPDS